MLEAINYFFLVLAAVTCMCCSFGSIFSKDEIHRTMYVICAVINAAFTVHLWSIAL